MTTQIFRITPVYDLLLRGSEHMPVGLYHLQMTTSTQLCNLHYTRNAQDSLRQRPGIPRRATIYTVRLVPLKFTSLPVPPTGPYLYVDTDQTDMGLGAHCRITEDSLSIKLGTNKKGRTAFINPDESLQAAHKSIDSFYKQILVRRAAYQITDKTPSDRTIEGHFKDLARQLDAYMETEKDQAIEPER